MPSSVDIPDVLYRQLKALAAREGVTVKTLVLRSLKNKLGGQPRKRRRRIKLPFIRSKEPGTLQLDNAKIYELIDFP
ncbi:MAG TPA: hypothetical protein VKG84_08000 [Candidatus Acidoferrales bacterium]|nr:hypothetical protein [Candidatus Acidoferrales bacterium]